MHTVRLSFILLCVFQLVIGEIFEKHFRAATLKGKVGLVLSGGGSKGAFQLGQLQAICENEILRNSWSIITGSSIGALQAGMLGQFNKEDQCSKGISQAASFWKAIKGPSNIYKSSSKINSALGIDCLDKADSVSMGSAFFEHGGFCDASPG